VLGKAVVMGVWELVMGLEMKAGVMHVQGVVERAVVEVEVLVVEVGEGRGGGEEGEGPYRCWYRCGWGWH
jgi:hypothetical protein